MNPLEVIDVVGYPAFLATITAIVARVGMKG